jgi:hypothetical protein
MTSHLRSTGLALAFVATAVPASAQTWIYEPDYPRARAYERAYEPRIYEPPIYGERAYDPNIRPMVTNQPLALTPAQRTTIYRTIIPQGRGPIVKERIVTETIAPAPLARERVVTPPVVADYAVGARVTDAYALAPMPRALVATVPAVRSYRYMVINNRLLLVDPATGYVVADVSE